MHNCLYLQLSVDRQAAALGDATESASAFTPLDFTIAVIIMQGLTQTSHIQTNMLVREKEGISIRTVSAFSLIWCKKSVVFGEIKVKYYCEFSIPVRYNEVRNLNCANPLAVSDELHSQLQ